MRPRKGEENHRINKVRLALQETIVGGPVAPLLIQKENKKQTGISSKSYLKLSLGGPHLPNLDLLDLPELVLNATGDEPKTMQQDANSVVDSVINETKGRAVYLAVRKVNVEWRQSLTILILIPFVLQSFNTILLFGFRHLIAYVLYDEQPFCSLKCLTNMQAHSHSPPLQFNEFTCLHLNLVEVR